MATKRQIEGNRLFQQRFEEHGLTNKFEFLGRDWESDHGRKVNVRCKTCNAEFQTWNVEKIFCGKVKKLCCPECGMTSLNEHVWIRSEKCQEAMEYYANGHTVLETAEKFNISPGQITNAVQRFGVSNGRDFHEVSEVRRTQIREESENKISKRLNELGFDYVGGYVNNKGKIKIKCQRCGSIFERTVPFVRCNNVICRKCEHEKTLRRHEEIKKQKQREREEKAKANKVKPNGPTTSWYQKQREKRFDEVFICKECGKEYTPRDYVASYNGESFSNPGFCSCKCKKKFSNRKNHKSFKNHYIRARKYGCVYDHKINLQKLIAKRGLRCAICGEMCNPNDHRWTEYFGPTSPTLDHIIPLSKGGNHTWDNVQIAHAICNSRKRDLVEGVNAHDAS